MTKTRMSIVTLSLALAATLAFAGMAAARPHYMGGPGGLTVEQMTAMQELGQQYGQKMQPLMQMQWAKQSELEALYAAGAKDDDAKVQSVRKELTDISNKLYAADADMRKQMQDKGIPYMGGMGMMGRGFGPCGGYGPRGGMMGPGYGPRGHMGYGSHGYGHMGYGGYGGMMGPGYGPDSDER